MIVLDSNDASLLRSHDSVKASALLVYRATQTPHEARRLRQSESAADPRRTGGRTPHMR